MNTETCPYCTSSDVTAVLQLSHGKCEYLCERCGEYFVSDQPED